MGHDTAQVQFLRRLVITSYTKNNHVGLLKVCTMCMRAINSVVVMLYYEAMTTFGGSETADQNPRDVGTQENPPDRELL
jgi:hypothetical protein